jgi:hypothetical protein
MPNYTNFIDVKKARLQGSGLSHNDNGYRVYGPG